MALVIKDIKLIAGNEELLVPRRNSEVSQYIGDKKVFGITFLKTLTLLGLGLIKINTVSANFKNPRPWLILKN